MTSVWRSALSAAGVAAGSTAAALALALALAPVFNDAPVPLFLSGVLVSAWIGGAWPGFVATGLSALALVRFFDLSRASPLPGPEDTAFDLVLFIVVASLISWLTAGLRLANRRLAVARAEAEAAARAREEFLAAAAHDLKSPLAGITMAASFARRRLEHTDADSPARTSIVRQLSNIEDDSRRMSQLVDELLDYARLQAGRGLSLNLAPTRLLTLVKAAVEAHQRRTDRHQIRLVGSADPFGVWDAARVTRVLDNLLSNAIKYSPQGGEISIEVAEEEGCNGTRMAAVRVRDHGVGIPVTEMAHIFERFFRAANVAEISGTGIGLSGARRIVEQHGGSLTAESREGMGSTFILRLPIAAARCASTAADPPAPAGSARA